MRPVGWLPVVDWGCLGDYYNFASAGAVKTLAHRHACVDTVAVSAVDARGVLVVVLPAPSDALDLGFQQALSATIFSPWPELAAEGVCLTGG